MCECGAAYTVVSSNLVSDLHRNDLKTHYDKVNHLLTEEKVKEKQLNISFPFHHCQKKMHWTIIFLIIIIYMPMIQSQVWGGIFSTTPGCVQASCCCPTTDIQVYEYSNTIALNLTLDGSLCMNFATLFQTNLPKPDGFSLTMTVFIVTFTVTMSSDSNTITVSSTLGSQCTVVANRIGTLAAIASTTQSQSTSAAQKYVTPSVLFYFSFVCLVLK